MAKSHMEIDRLIKALIYEVEKAQIEVTLLTKWINAPEARRTGQFDIVLDQEHFAYSQQEPTMFDYSFIEDIINPLMMMK